MLKVKQTTPWLLLTGILSVLGIIAMTDLMQPIIRFIHTDQGSSLQLIGCILFSIIGFRIAYVLLDKVCNYYSDRFDEKLNITDKSKHQ